MNEREERAAYVLDAWADAIRGDWSTIDGRGCKASLNQISAYLRGTRDGLTFDDVGVCQCDGSVGTHWYGDLWGEMCPGVAAEGPPDA